MKLFLFLLLIIYCDARAFDKDSLVSAEKKKLGSVKKAREKWMKQIHKTEPGIDYKILDNETRHNRSLARQKARPSIQQALETIADGKISGTWTEKGSKNQAGRMLSADIDFTSGQIYAGSAGGNIWRGNLDGSDWEVLNDKLNFGYANRVRIYKKEGLKRIIAVCNQRVWYTENEGAEWREATGMENITANGSIKNSVVLDNGDVYLLSMEWDPENWEQAVCVRYSSDGGLTFDKIAAWDWGIYDLTDIAAAEYENAQGAVYLAVRDTLHKIEKGSFINKKIIEEPEMRYLLDNNLMVRAELSAVTRNGATSLVYVCRQNDAPMLGYFYSHDEGNKWELTGDFTSFDRWSYAVSADDPSFLYWGNVNMVRSTDKGKTWEQIGSWDQYYNDPLNILHADIPSINSFIDPSGNEVVLISTDGGIYVSYDKLATVKNLSLSGLNVSQYYDVMTNDGRNAIYAGSQDQGLQKTLEDASGQVMDFDQVLSGDYGHFSSADGGKTLWTVYPTFALAWKDFDTPAAKPHYWMFQENNWMFISPTAPDYDDPDILYICGGNEGWNGSLWRLTLTDGTIIPHKFPYDFFAESEQGKVAAIATNPAFRNNVYTMTDNGFFFVSADKGANWTKKTGKGPAPHYFHGSCILPSQKDASLIYVAGAGYSVPGGVLRSTDGGDSFEAMSDGLPNTMVYDIKFGDNEDYIFAATATGPYIYVKAAGRWYDMAGQGAPDQTYWAVEYLADKKTVRFATHGRGIWDFKITAIADVKNSEPAENISMEIYPNPASDRLTLKAVSALGEKANIKIYDNAGRVLLSEPVTLAPGDNEISLNLPSFMTSGVYPVLLSTAKNTYYKLLDVSK